MGVFSSARWLLLEEGPWLLQGSAPSLVVSEHEVSPGSRRRTLVLACPPWLVSTPGQYPLSMGPGEVAALLPQFCPPSELRGNLGQHGWAERLQSELSR